MFAKREDIEMALLTLSMYDGLNYILLSTFDLKKSYKFAYQSDGKLFYIIFEKDTFVWAENIQSVMFLVDNLKLVHLDAEINKLR